MAENLDSATLVSSSSNTNSGNINHREGIHLLAKIPEKITKKLYGIAIANIFVGIISIGLDFGLMISGDLG